MNQVWRRDAVSHRKGHTRLPPDGARKGPRMNDRSRPPESHESRPLDIAYSPVAVWNSRQEAARRRERADRPHVRPAVAALCTFALLAGMLMTILGSSLSYSVVLQGDGAGTPRVADAPSAPITPRAIRGAELISVSAATPVRRAMP